MKKSLYFVFFTFFLTGGLQAAPQLSVEAPSYDFGAVQGEPIIQHSFSLENKGDTPLIIRRIQASCGCTTPGVSQLRIEPGEQADLPVKMDLKGRSGKQRQVITLHTNDPDRRHFPLTMTGEVVPVIQITPRTLNLMHIDPENPKVGIVELKSTEDNAFKVTKVESLNDRVDTRVIPSEDGTSAVIEVTPLRQPGQGHFTDVLMIDTSDKRIRGKRVLVMWQIQSGVTVTPGSLNLIHTKNAAPQQRYFMIKSPPDQKEEFEVTGAEWPGREEVEILISENRFGWRVHLKDLVPNKEMAGEHLIFKTNAEGFAELKVPVRMLER